VGVAIVNSRKVNPVKHVLFWIGLLLLILLHHDWWFWTDGRLLFGFLPVGLAYHALISLAAGCFWAWAAYDAMAAVFQPGGGGTESS
jgi:hypothetical protein